MDRHDQLRKKRREELRGQLPQIVSLVLNKESRAAVQLVRDLHVLNDEETAVMAHEILTVAFASVPGASNLDRVQRFLGDIEASCT